MNNVKKGERIPGSGRKKGKPNAATKTLLERCDEKGIDLFEAMLELIEEAETNQEKFQYIKEAAQYVYPKRKALEHSTDPTKEFVVTIRNYVGKKD